jgi:hypothetical protein
MPEEIVPEVNDLCDICGEAVKGDESNTVEDCSRLVCSDCFENDFSMCERNICDYIGQNDAMFSVDGETWCQSCAEEYSYICSECSDRVSDYYYIEPAGETLCESCYDHLDGFYCSDCDERHLRRCHRRPEGLYSWDYKPEPEFIPALPPYSINLSRRNSWRGSLPEQGKCSISRAQLMRYGLELETEACGADIGQALDWQEELLGEAVYPKRDGSLSDDGGVEWVSHPASLDHWKNWAAFAEFVERLRAKGWRSWDCEGVGIHVHASRVAFDGSSHIARVVAFSRSNAVEFQRFAGRSASRWARFEDLRGPLPDKVGRYSASHYDAVNCSGSATIEFRMFRGSLRYGRILADIECVHGVIEFTRGLSAFDFGKDPRANWGEFVRFMRQDSELYRHALAVVDGGRFNSEQKVN